MKLSRPQWEKVLFRFIDHAPIPEEKLIVSVIALAISEEQGGDGNFRRGFFGEDGAFNPYCRMLGLSPDFVRGQIDAAEAFTR